MSAILKLLLGGFGVALFILGAIWALQGAGILNWPADSFMLADRSWALYGAVTAAIGFVLALVSTRINR
ncbi:hypothetical protein MACH24_21530 [Erythrobacter sp. Dej080120_24]|uniref:hypothetical protein n=1 Tax=unclassified Erythrobacter TaxID=2633097 RepID=UPI002924E415|nr:hypothetical protein MACH24_21530 [Erythrobacter sp. Dej080120_24]